MALPVRPFRRKSLPLNLLKLEDRTVPTVVVGNHAVGQYPFGWLGGEDVSRQDLPSSHFITNPIGELTGPQPGDRNSLALQNLREYAGMMNIPAADVQPQLVTFTDSYADQVGTMQHVYLRQTVNGRPVLNSSIGVHYTGDGRLTTINGGFFPGLAALNTLDGFPAPVVTPAAAVVEAAYQLGYDVTADPTDATPTGGDPVLLAPQASTAPIKLTTAYVYSAAAGTARPVWHFDIQTPTGNNWYDVGVDTQTGELLFSNNWTDHLGTYNVFAAPVAEPNDPRTGGQRSYEVNPYDPRYSPYGWHDTNGQPGAEYTDTRGNNVSATLDLDDTDPDITDPTTGGNRFAGGAGLVFDGPLNFSQSPGGYRNAALTQLFYDNNLLHDYHYAYGFTEAAGNFQRDNYTGAGIGGDQVNADAQNGFNAFPQQLDNAFFATPPDGTSGRMSMFIFDYTNPNRDSDLDNDVMFHEYGHGVSNRLTGGPANASALESFQSGGMGEGWSDFYSLMFTQLPTDAKQSAYPIGNYMIGANQATGPGIRRHPYSFNMSIDPLTYGDYNAAGTQPEVHDTGEIWCSTLWDLNWLLIDKYGFDPDITTGYAPGGGPASAGNKLALRLVMDALKLQPANPSFTEARDAILQADQQLTGGLNRREIWTAFARRGLGSGASTANSNATGSTAVTLSTAMPPEASHPGIIAVTPPGRSNVAPGSIAVTFSEPMNPSSFSPAADILSFTAPSGGNLIPAVTGFTWSANNTVLTINFLAPAGDLGQGAYALTLGPDILAADDGSKLDQNLNGTAGEAADAFTAYFQYDKTQLAVTSFSPAAGSLVTSDLAYIDVQFNEPVNPATVTADDLQVSAGQVVTGATVMGDGSIVRFTLGGLPTGTVYLQIKQDAVTDKFGFGTLTAHSSIQVAASTVTTPLPTPLVPLAPLGSQSYQTSGSTSGTLGSTQDLAQYTIALEAGVTLNTTVTPAAGLTPKIVVVAPGGAPLATVVAPAAGQPARITGLSIPTAGTYTIQVSATAGFGTFTVDAQLNTGVEAESLGGAANNTRPTAQALTGFRTVDTGKVTTVLGTSEAATPDYYSLALAVGDVLSAGLRQLSGGQTATITVLDPTGVVVAGSTVAGGGAGYTAVANRYVATSSGTYYVRVQDTAAHPYTLTVAANAVLDAEPNDTGVTAIPVSPAKVALGGLLTPGDVDVYTFVSVAGNLLRLTTATPGDAVGEPANTLDTFLTLTTPSGTVLTDDNSAPDGRNALLTLSAPEDGTYTLAVSVAAGTASTGAYTLTVFNRTNRVPTGISAGGPYHIREGDSLALNAAATDPDGDALTYSWDINGDGIYGDASGPNPNVSWPKLDMLKVDGTTTPYTVKVLVSDGTTPLASQGVTLIVDDVPPSAVLLDTTVFEGQPTTLTVTGASDPSSVDTKAGFKYAFDIGDDGTIDVGDGTYGKGVDSNATIPASYFPDGGNGKTVKVRMYVIDKDNVSSSTTATIQVLNAPPTGTPVTSAVSEGQSATVSLANVIDPSPVDTQAGFTYAYDFNDDGVFEVVGSDKSSYSVPAQYTDDGPGTSVVRVRVTDKDGGSSTYRVRVTVNNVAPTATFFNPGPVSEGSTGTVTFAGSFDPSVADTTAGLRYAYDFNNDGTFDLGGASYASAVTASSATVPASYFTNGPSSLTVRGRIIDKDGGFNDYLTTLTTTNVAPTATLTVVPTAADQRSVKEGQPATVRFDNPTDPSAADTAAGFTYAFDYNNDGVWDAGDGTYAGGVGPVGTIPAALLDNGPTTRTVRGRILDRDGGFTDLVVTVSVSNEPPTASPVIGPQVTVGSPSTLSLTGASDPSPADTAAGFTYSFDFDNDGVYEVSGTSPTASFTYAKPGSYPVRLRVSDRDGGSTTYSGRLEVANVAPTATLTADGPIPEGGTASVHFTNPQQPSPVATAAGFRYAYDLDNDGKFELGDGTYVGSLATPDATLPAALTANSGTRTVRARIVELNGLFTDYTTTVTVTNVAPTATPVTLAGPVEAGQPVTLGLNQVVDPSPSDRANLTYSFDFTGDGTFDVTGSKSPTATYSYPAAGTFQAVIRVSDPDGGSNDYMVPVTVTSPAPAAPTAKSTYYAVGSDAGGGSVRLFNDFGTEVMSLRPFGDSYTGGVRVATADVTGDGVPDLVVGTGPGVASRVAVIDGSTRATVMDVQPFEAGFTGGVYVAAGDTDGDGKAEVVVTPDQGGGPVVAVYGMAGQKARFFGIEDPNFRGGARPALADMNGDGTADLLVAAGFGGGPRVAGFSGPSLTTGKPVKLFADFFVFEESLRNGVFVAAGDLNKDGSADLVVGGGPGGGPRVLALDGRSLTEGRQTVLANFFAGDPDSRDGVRVAVKDLDLDGDADVLAAAAGTSADSFRVRGYKASDLLTGVVQEKFLLDPFPGDLSGVYVG